MKTALVMFEKMAYALVAAFEKSVSTSTPATQNEVDLIAMVTSLGITPLSLQGGRFVMSARTGVTLATVPSQGDTLEDVVALATLASLDRVLAESKRAEVLEAAREWKAAFEEMFGTFPESRLFAGKAKAPTVLQ